jgi:2-oxoglutarate/2-oxoacid ferredoxin oxidoreductase subunit alpha
VPELEVFGEQEGELLVIGWGSTLGPITGAVGHLRQQGIKVSRAHFRYLNPFPRNTGEVLSRFKRVMLPEMNCGQLALLLRARFLKDIVSYSKVEGKPFTRHEIQDRIMAVLGQGGAQ